MNIWEKIVLQKKEAFNIGSKDKICQRIKEKRKWKFFVTTRQIENICKSSCHKSKGQNKAMAMIKYSIDNLDAPQYWLDQCVQFDP